MTFAELVVEFGPSFIPVLLLLLVGSVIFRHVFSKKEPKEVNPINYLFKAFAEILVIPFITFFTLISFLFIPVTIIFIIIMVVCLVSAVRNLNKYAEMVQDKRKVLLATSTVFSAFIPGMVFWLFLIH